MARVLATQDAKSILNSADITLAYCHDLLSSGFESITDDCAGRGVLEYYQRGTDWTEEQAAYYWMTEQLDGLLSIVRAAEHMIGRVRDDLEALPCVDEIGEDDVVLKGRISA